MNDVQKVLEVLSKAKQHSDDEMRISHKSKKDPDTLALETTVYAVQLLADVGLNLISARDYLQTKIEEEQDVSLMEPLAFIEFCLSSVHPGR
jgi:hypothetical protein